ncbi:MAG: prepilin peptidase [Lachnospiraceae bacterium]|nr:prepilin peptidase [Lachnospiraceae bacterium]
MTGWMIITCTVLFYTAAEDSRRRKIDRKPVLLMILLGLTRPDRGAEELCRDAGTALAVFAVILAVYLISEGSLFGGGDVRLFSAEAFLLKESEMILALVSSAVLLLAYCIYIRKKHSGDRQIPAAVFLCPGMILSLIVSAAATNCLKI